MKLTPFAGLLVACTIAVFLLACGVAQSARAIEGEVERGPGHVFALADHTDFEWERVFLFGPYTGLDEIETELGIPGTSKLSTDIELSDAVVLVVFVHAGQVVEHFDLSRARADLAPCVRAGRKVLTPETAVFVVGANGTVSLEGTPGSD